MLLIFYFLRVQLTHLDKQDFRFVDRKGRAPSYLSCNISWMMNTKLAANFFVVFLRWFIRPVKSALVCTAKVPASLHSLLHLLHAPSRVLSLGCFGQSRFV
jgi:hypothetical protein